MFMDNSYPDTVQESANVRQVWWCVTNTSQLPTVQNAPKNEHVHRTSNTLSSVTKRMSVRQNFLQFNAA